MFKILNILTECHNDRHAMYLFHNYVFKAWLCMRNIKNDKFNSCSYVSAAKIFKKIDYCMLSFKSKMAPEKCNKKTLKY